MDISPEGSNPIATDKLVAALVELSLVGYPREAQLLNKLLNVNCLRVSTTQGGATNGGFRVTIKCGKAEGATTETNLIDALLKALKFSGMGDGR